jgi:hypothetical protein
MYYIQIFSNKSVLYVVGYNNMLYAAVDLRKKLILYGQITRSVKKV